MLQRLRYFYICFLFLLFQGFTPPPSEDNGFLTVQGTTEFNNKPFPGVIITVFENGTKVNEIKSNKKARFELELEYNNTYKVMFSAAGFSEMYMTIDGTIPQKALPLWAGYEITVVMHKADDELINHKAYQNPFTKVSFYEKTKQFRDDENHIAFFETALNDINAGGLGGAAIKKIGSGDKQRTFETKEQEITVTSPETSPIPDKQVTVPEKEVTTHLPINKENVAKVLPSDPKNTLHTKGTGGSQKLSAGAEYALSREAAEKEKLKNQQVKKEQENSLLKNVAEAEKTLKTGPDKNRRKITEQNEVTTTLDANIAVSSAKEELYAAADNKHKTALLNKGSKADEEFSLLETAARNEVELKKKLTSPSLKPAAIDLVEKPLVEQKTIADKQREERYTYLKFANKQTVYKRVTYRGTERYYCDNNPIEESRYIKDLSKYITKNKM